MVDEAYRERNRTYEQIRRHGAVGNLNDGIEITTHGLSTRVIAWPGNGFQTQSIHVLTLRPGEQSEMYCYDMAEEALLCLQGKGEVYLRGSWVEIEAGDVAFFPAAVKHAVRSPHHNQRDFVLVTQICPPQFYLYESAGYYDRAGGVMNLEAIERAKKQAKLGSLSPTNEPHLNESHPHLRAWNLTAEDIRRQGALFNVYKGASFGELAIPMLLVLWPGYGVRSAGLHSGVTAPGQRSVIHTHPDSDECLFNWVGKGQVYCGDRWINSDAFDCLLAPCGVSHGEGGSLDPAGASSAGCGFASPPQLDLYLRTPYFTDGTFRQPKWSTLQAPQDRSHPQ